MSSNVLLQEKQEYIDVVKQQRAELNMERQKVTEMQRWIVMQKAGERQQLLLQLLEQQNRVSSTPIPRKKSFSHWNLFGSGLRLGNF